MIALAKAPGVVVKLRATRVTPTGFDGGYRARLGYRQVTPLGFDTLTCEHRWLAPFVVQPAAPHRCPSVLICGERFS